jgi:hypothetical protein
VRKGKGETGREEEREEETEHIPGAGGGGRLGGGPFGFLPGPTVTPAMPVAGSGWRGSTTDALTTCFCGLGFSLLDSS